MITARPSSDRVACLHYADREVPVAVEIAHFRGAGGVEEVHLMARPTECADFAVQLDWLRRGYGSALEAIGLAGGATVLRRFFCRDLPSQAPLLAACPFADPTDSRDACAISWVGQPPPDPAKVALWAYGINDPGGNLDKRREGRTLTLQRHGLSHHWTSGVTAANGDCAAGQTQSILTAYEAALQARGLSVAGNLVRTWFFVRDIDADYQGLVDARREFLARRGLTPQTHYVASTGIGGGSGPADAKVGMDAYAIGGVQPQQIEYLRAPDHFCPTFTYGVTFERATAISYRDRKHVLISGTASIDPQGKVLHPGDISAQTARTLDNIEALLSEAGATPHDVCMVIAYLRDLADEPLVRAGIEARFGPVPLTIVNAPVCRPTWLVEIEAQAIVPADNPELPEF